MKCFLCGQAGLLPRWVRNVTVFGVTHVVCRDTRACDANVVALVAATRASAR